MSTLEAAKRQPTLASVWQAMADGKSGMSCSSGRRICSR
jgi:hypothetical protein